MPTTSSQKKTYQLPENRKKNGQVPNWKAALLEKKRVKNECQAIPQWKVEMLKRKKEHSYHVLENNSDFYARLSFGKKAHYSSVPCLSSSHDDDFDESIPPIRSNPIFLLDQERRRSLNFEEQSDIMVEKLSDEMYRENLMQGELEYGKGFVGKLLKKFNSLVNVSGGSFNEFISFAKKDKYVKTSNNCNNTLESNHMKSAKNYQTAGNQEHDFLKLTTICAEKNDTKNNGRPQATTARADAGGGAINLNKQSELLHKKNAKSFANGEVCKQDAVGEPLICPAAFDWSVADVDDYMHGDILYSLRTFKKRTGDQTKSVLENISRKRYSAVEGGMELFGKMSGNSRFYGGHNDNKSKFQNKEKVMSPENNLPDILLSSSPQQSDHIVDKKLQVTRNDHANGFASSNNISSLPPKKDFDAKEKSKVGSKMEGKMAENRPEGDAITMTTSSNSRSLSSTSSAKSNKPGSLLVRTSSNMSFASQGLNPYKDIRATPGSELESDRKSNPDASDIPVTDIDNIIISTHYSLGKIKDNSSSNKTLRDEVVTKAKASIKLHGPQESISHVKSLLLDTPKSLHGGDVDEPTDSREGEEICEEVVAFEGDGVIHKKSALSKSKNSKRKMSVTFLDPATDAQIFEYPAEDKCDEEGSTKNATRNIDAMKSSPNNYSHLSNYKSKMHVNFEFGSSGRDELYDFFSNHETSDVQDGFEPTNTAPPVSSSWSNYAGLDLLF